MVLVLLAFDMNAGALLKKSYLCGTGKDRSWLDCDGYSPGWTGRSAQIYFNFSRLSFIKNVNNAMERLIDAQSVSELFQGFSKRGGVRLFMWKARMKHGILRTCCWWKFEVIPNWWAREMGLRNKKFAHALSNFCMGRPSPELWVTIVAGPNHVLPTSGTGKIFKSPLVFMISKRSSLFTASPEGAKVNLQRIGSPVGFQRWAFRRLMLMSAE